MWKKFNLNDFKCGTVVGATQVFKKLINFWGFPTLPSPGFTVSPEKEKYGLQQMVYSSRRPYWVTSVT